GQALLLPGGKVQQGGGAVRSVGRLTDQGDGLVQQVLVLRVDHQGRDAHFSQGVGAVLQLEGQDDQIRLQRQAALQVELLGGAHTGQVQQLGGAAGVDGPAVRLGLDAYQLVLQPQGDEQAGGNVIAADQRLGLGLEGHFPPRLVGQGQGGGGLGRFAGRRSRAGRSAGSGGAAGGRAAGGQVQGQRPRQHQRKDSVLFHDSLLLARCSFETTTQL